jgi:hypothetical protein
VLTQIEGMSHGQAELWKEYGDRHDFALLVVGREESDDSVSQLRAIE